MAGASGAAGDDQAPAPLDGEPLAGRRILVVGSARQALAACRDLGRAGATVDVARRPGERDLATGSRFVATGHVVPDPQSDPAAFADEIGRIVRTARHDVVFPAGDEYLLALSGLRDALEAVVPLAPHGSVGTILDKVALDEVAGRVGFRSPETVEATDAAVDAWTGPAIVKDRSHWNPGAGPSTHRRAVATSDRATLRAAVQGIRAQGGRPVIQQVAPGRMLCFGAFRSSDGVVSGRIQQTSDELWPYPLGTTARATTQPPDPALAEAVGALLDELHWVGMVNLQLFRDGDRHTLIDFNGRFNHSLALALAAGVRFPVGWALDALSVPGVRLPDARPGVRLSILSADLKRARVQRRGGLLRDLAGTVAFGVTAHHTIPDRHDPGPALRYLLGRSGGA